MKDNNILITSAGRRVSLVKSFQNEMGKLNIKGKVFCTDLEPEISSACQVADHSFKVKKVTDENYLNDLIKLVIDNNIKIIIPTIDTELKVLSSNIDLFKKENIEVIISDEYFIDQCRDKRQIHLFFDEKKFPRANDVNLNDTSFPIFIKPYDGSRSVGLLTINSKEELTQEVISNPKNMFLEYLDHKDYTEFTIDIYFSKKSKILSIVPRERISVRDGEVNKACTRKNELLKIVLDKFDNVEGLRGCITLQVFLHNENRTIKGIEINPRFGGGYPLSYIAGANFPKWIIQEYILNKELNEYSEEWKDNTLMLRYDSEVISYGYKS